MKQPGVQVTRSWPIWRGVAAAPATSTTNTSPSIVSGRLRTKAIEAPSFDQRGQASQVGPPTIVRSVQPLGPRVATTMSCVPSVAEVVW